MKTGQSISMMGHGKASKLRIEEIKIKGKRNVYRFCALHASWTSGFTDKNFKSDNESLWLCLYATDLARGGNNQRTFIELNKAKKNYEDLCLAP